MHQPKDESPVVQGPPEVSEWERDHVGPGGCRGFSIAVSQMQRRWQELETAVQSRGEEDLPQTNVGVGMSMMNIEEWKMKG